MYLKDYLYARYEAAGLSIDVTLGFKMPLTNLSAYIVGPVGIPWISSVGEDLLIGPSVAGEASYCCRRLNPLSKGNKINFLLKKY